MFFGIIWRRNNPEGNITLNAFSRELGEYDLFNAEKRVLEGENPELIERRLSRLQNQVRSVEDQLSVLKRRRILSFTDRRYIAAYAKAAREAAEAFPHSAPLALTASEAVILADTAISAEVSDLLRSYSARISQNRFGLPELSVHILAGNLENPGRAAGTPGLENLLSLDLSGFPNQTRLDLLVDEFLLRALKGNIPGATVRLNSLLAAAETQRSGADLKRMGAEFFYDHNNPLKAAELFSQLSEERDMARAADALVLAGELPGARNIWLALSSGTAGNTQGTLTGNLQRNFQGNFPQVRNRSLYNLAASSVNRREEASWLEAVFSGRSQNEQTALEDSTMVFSVIRYTRILDTPRSIAVLDELKQHPLLDLELLRRRLETWPHNRAAAEVWMLIERNNENDALYEWAAWYFDHQKLYAETQRLLREADRKAMSGSWIDLHRSLALIRDGKTPEGEKILKDAERRYPDWRIYANLGRIQESRRAVNAAVEYYEAAAALVRENTAAALVQMRLSRCLQALGRGRESLRALEYAQELDPDNLNIRRELARELARENTR